MSTTFPVVTAAPEAAASRSETSRAWRRIFSFPVTICGLLAVLGTLTVSARLNDPDTWWHLRLGQFMWKTRSIPQVDVLSYSTARHSVIPHEWLSQLCIFAAYQLGGLTGMMLWLTFFSVALLVAGYAFCTLYSGNAKTSFVGALMIWLFSTVGLAIRPHLIGYLLLIAELTLIHLGRTRSSRWFFALPPLFALWINIHGSFFIGLVVAAIFLLSSFFQFNSGSLSSQAWPRPTQLRFLIAMLLATGCLFLNPGGIRQILYPLDTMFRQPINLANIEEWQPLQLSGQRGVFVLVTLAILFLLIAMRKADLHLHELLLFGIGLWLACSHARLLFVFGILVAPTLSRMLSAVWENYSFEQDRILPNVVMLSLALAAVLIAFPSSKNLSAQVNAANPVKAVEYIRSHHLPGPILNDYRYGGYLIWAAPEYPVFIDGRADLYEWAGVLGPYGRWATLQEDPRLLPSRYGVRTILLPAGAPMVQTLPFVPGWKAVYSDSNAIVFSHID